MNDTTTDTTTAAPTDASPEASGDGATELVAGLTFTADDAAGDVDPQTLAAQLASAAPDARLALAMAPRVLRAVATMQLTEDALGAEELARTVKAHGVPLGPWRTGVARTLSALRHEARAAAEAEHREALRRQREADAEAAERRRRDAEAKRASAPGALAPFHGRWETAGGIAVEMEPGRCTAEVPDKPDKPPKVRHLMNAAARLAAVVSTEHTPGAPPESSFRVEFALRHGTPFAVDIPAERFNDTAGWITPATAGRVMLEPGRDVSDLARLAINATRDGATEVHRRAFLGWVHDGGRWMRVHAAGAIDAAGEAEGVDVLLTEKRLARFALPAPPTGNARADALDVLRELVLLEPADAVLPVVAFVVRAMMGPGAGVMHVHGSANTGKSLFCALALALAGEGFGGRDSAPGSWDQDTPAFTLSALARAGDCPWGIDDWRPAGDPQGARFLAVTRAVFNGTGRGALARTRAFNTTPEPRGSLLSNGEAVPSGGAWSGLSRVCFVELPSRVAMQGGGVYVAGDGEEHPERAFTARAPAALHLAGAALVQWLAARLDTWREPGAAKLRPGVERAALARMRVPATDRAVDVLAPIALGAEVLVRFLREERAMPARDLDALSARFGLALGALAGERTAMLTALMPGRSWCSTLGALMRAGKCHAAEVRGGKLIQTPPEGREAWGWRLRAGSWEGQGPCVGHLDPRRPDALCVDPEVALTVMREAAQRAGGGAEIHSRAHLARELDAAGLLASTGKAGEKRRLQVHDRVNGELQYRLAVKLSAVTADDDDTGDTADDAA